MSIWICSLAAAPQLVRQLRPSRVVSLLSPYDTFPVFDGFGSDRHLQVPIHDIVDLKKVARREGIRIAVIAVPAPFAQHVLGLVVAAGIKAVLNFSPGSLQVPADVKLKSVDLTVSLESLSFFLAQADSDEK